MKYALYAILAVVVLAAVGVVADTFIRLSGRGPSSLEPRLFLVGLLLYVATVPGWFIIMKRMSFPVLGAVYALATVLLLTTVGVFYFEDSLSPAESVGVLLALAALILLSRFG